MAHARTRPRARWWLALVLWALSSATYPCSVSDGYRVPCHVELVQDAEAIVLARALEFHPSADNPSWGRFVFRRLRVLKGAPIADRFEADGTPEFEGRTEEDELYRVRTGALTGSCIAHDYRVDHNYLLFGAIENGRFFVRGPPFSRVSEEVDGEASPWTQAVARYAEVGGIEDPEARYAAIEELLAAAREERDSERIPGSLARDMVRFLSSPSRYHPWPVLLGMYRSASDEKARLTTIEAMAGCDYGLHEESVKTFLRGLEDPARWEASLSSLAAIVKRTRASFCVDRLIDGYAAEEKDQDEVARAIRVAADPSQLPAIFERVRDLRPEAGALLAPLFAGRPGSPEVEAWRARVATRLREVVDDRCCDKYWETIGLAGLGDRDVLDWAVAGLEDPDSDGCCGLRPRVLVWSPLPQAREYVERLVADRRTQALAKIVFAYDDSPWPVPWDLLGRIARLAPRDDRLDRNLLELFGTLAHEGQPEARQRLALLKEVRAAQAESRPGESQAGGSPSGDSRQEAAPPGEGQRDEAPLDDSPADESRASDSRSHESPGGGPRPGESRPEEAGPVGPPTSWPAGVIVALGVLGAAAAALVGWRRRRSRRRSRTLSTGLLIFVSTGIFAFVLFTEGGPGIRAAEFPGSGGSSSTRRTLGRRGRREGQAFILEVFGNGDAMFRTLTDSGCVILSVASVLVGAEGGGAAGRRPLVRGTDGGVDVRDGGEAFADWVYSEVANRIEDPWLTSAQRSAVKAALERANEAIESIVPFRGTIEEMERWAREAIQAGTESRLAGVRLAKVGFWKEVEGILSGEQREELKTRWFRSRGPLILVDEDVAEQVGLSADQRIAIRAVVRWSAVEMAKVDAEMRELWARFRLEGLDGPTGRDMAPLTRRKLEYIRRRNAILAELLEEEQKSAFARVRGAPFEWNGGGQGSATRRPGESSGSGTEGRKEGEAKAADKGDEQ